jgi:hypothetical protein
MTDLVLLISAFRVLVLNRAYDDLQRDTGGNTNNRLQRLMYNYRKLPANY